MNTTPDTINLPEVSDLQVARMEKHIMNEIHAQKASAASRGSARGKWITGLGIASAFAIGALVSPLALQSMTTASGAAGAPQLVQPSTVSGAEMAGSDVMSIENLGSDGGRELAAADSLTAVDGAAQDVVKSANVELLVPAVREAVDKIEANVVSLGGYVQSVSIGTNPVVQPRPVDLADVSVTESNGYMSVRVPAAELEGFVQQLSGYGTITASTLSADDQTQWGNELRSQVDAGQASLDRLTELLGEATSLTDIITLEQAIADRQAQLQWQTQALNDLESRVAMSNVWINFTTPAAAVQPEPSGFVDGVKAGWNGFIASLNAVVLAAGFVIPWIALLGIPALLIWWFVKSRRNKASDTKASETPAD